MDDPSRFKLHVDGVERDTFGWADFQPLFDAYVTALGAMTGGPGASDVVLLQIGRGSAEPQFLAPRSAAKSMAMLAAGPTDRWTQQQRRAAESLYQIVRRRGLSLKVGQRRLQPVVIPPQAPACRLREGIELRARVQTVGYADLHAQMEFEGEGVIRVDGPDDVMRDMGKHIHGSVYVNGEATWDVTTGTLLQFKAVSCRPAPEKTSTQEAMARLHEAVGGVLDGVSIRETFGRSAG